MRKIQTKQEKDRKKSRNAIIVGLILVALMVVSTAGFAFLGKTPEQDERKIIYEGFEFNLNENGLWQTNIGNQIFRTRYNPVDSENITLPFLVSLQDYSNRPLYFVSENQIAVNELWSNLYPYVQRVQFSCVENRNCSDSGLPIKNCSTDNIIIIDYVSDLEEELAYKQDNCIFIKNNNPEKAADALLFKMIGIRKL